MESLNMRSDSARKNPRRPFKASRKAITPTSSQKVGDRRRFSITLSKKASEAFDWLKEFTDSDTDSEVIRNALRLHHVLLQRAAQGDTFFVSSADGQEKLAKIELFVAQ